MTANWRDSVIAYIRAEATPADKFGHQPRLFALACRIAAELPDKQICDEDVLFAAAWMHDLGVFLGHRPSDPAELAGWDHVPYTLAKSRELLTAWGFPEEKLKAVEEAIRTHQARDIPVSIEAEVLRDADILEQLGAVGVLRAFVKVGRDTRYQTFSDVVPLLERHVERLPGELRLEPSKQLAGKRVEALAMFLAALGDEAGDLLY